MPLELQFYQNKLVILLKNIKLDNIKFYQNKNFPSKIKIQPIVLHTTLGLVVRTFCKSLLIFRMNEDTGLTIPVDVHKKREISL